MTDQPRFLIVSVNLNPQFNMIDATFRSLVRLSARSGRTDFTKSYLSTMSNRPDGSPSALRRLTESVYGTMPEAQAWEIDLETLVGKEVGPEIVSGRAVPKPEGAE